MQLKFKLQSFSNILKPNWHKIEILLFWLLIALSVSSVWSYKAFVTLDGPSHLYNSYLLGMMDNNPFISENYASNGLIISNYLSHILLNLFGRFLSPFNAEKLLISCILVFLPVTFRALVRCFGPNEKNLLLLAIPFLFNQLLILGFLNFNIAFILLNLQLVLVYKVIHSTRKWLWSVLFVLNSVLLFYSHGFVFILAFITTALITVFFGERDLKSIIRRCLKVTVISLPSLVMFFYFTIHHKISNIDIDLPLEDKISLLYKVNPFKMFGDVELAYNCLFMVFIFASIFIILLNKRTKDVLLLTNANDVFLLISFILFICYIFLMDGWASGVLTSRLSFSLLYFISLWICINGTQKNGLRLFLIISILWYYKYNSQLREYVFGNTASNAKEVAKASKFIEPNSYIYTHLNNPMWIEIHIDNYLAMNKPVVMLSNYEAELPWFPLRWKNDKLIKNIKNAVSNYDSSKINNLPEYIAFIGKTDLSKPEEAAIKSCIEKHGQKVYTSKSEFCTLYKINKLGKGF